LDITTGVKSGALSGGRCLTVVWGSCFRVHGDDGIIAVFVK
jgi:hypothetical protein